MTTDAATPPQPPPAPPAPQPVERVTVDPRPEAIVAARGDVLAQSLIDMSSQAATYKAGMDDLANTLVRERREWEAEREALLAQVTRLQEQVDVGEPPAPGGEPEPEPVAATGSKPSARRRESVAAQRAAEEAGAPAEPAPAQDKDKD